MAIIMPAGGGGGGGGLFINSLAPGRHRSHFKTAISNRVLSIGIFTSSKENALRWIPRDLTDDKSTLVQVMAWCRQATSHYLGANVYLVPCRHMASTGHNDLTYINLNVGCINNHMPSKVWDEITYPFPNCDGCTIEFGEWSVISSHTSRPPAV